VQGLSELASVAVYREGSTVDSDKPLSIEEFLYVNAIYQKFSDNKNPTIQYLVNRISPEFPIHTDYRFAQIVEYLADVVMLDKYED